jgi:hypothetical protein
MFGKGRNTKKFENPCVKAIKIAHVHMVEDAKGVLSYP